MCFGAWGKHVHAPDSVTGAARLSRQGTSSSTRAAARYYSPADCTPAFIGGRVYSPDRGFRMAVFTADNGQLESVNSNAVSIAVSPDGDWFCIKQSDGVTRLDGEGGKICRGFRLAPGHRVLAAPSVADGVIYQESPRAGVARRGEMCHNASSLHYSHTLAGQSTRINP